MLNYTFCGMGNLGLDAEQWLWKNGILCWNDYLISQRQWFSKRTHDRIVTDITEAQYMLSKGKTGLKWFWKKLTPYCQVRLYPHVRTQCRYLDIETTGLSASDNITVVGICNESEHYQFVREKNLREAIDLLNGDCIWVTCNGRTFDIPFLQREFGLLMPQFNIDLRFLLKGQGFPTGQKNAETALGILRLNEPTVHSGIEAVELWNSYQEGDLSSLERLMKYNLDDIAGLVKIFKTLYTLSMKRHPFGPK